MPAIAGAVISGVMASRGAKKSSRAVLDASRMSVGENKRQFDLVRKDTEPYREVGAENLNYLNEILRGGDTDFFKNITNQPYFEFNRQLGEDAVSNRLAKSGMRLSGRALKGISDYNQNYASGRMDNYLKQIAGMANYGVGGVNQSAQAGARSASNISNIYNNQGNQLSKIYGNEAANLNNAATGGLQNYYYSKYLKPGGSNFNYSGAAGQGL